MRLPPRRAVLVPVFSRCLQRGFRIPTETPELLHGVIQSPCFWSFFPALISKQLGKRWFRLSLKNSGLFPPFCLGFPLVKLGGKNQDLLPREQ